METKSQMINRIAELSQENAELKGELDAYKMSENEANEIIAELKAENERLKAELEPYKHPDVITLLTNWRTGELDRTHNKIANERDKLHQTLQEIKAIVCGNYEIIDP